MANTVYIHIPFCTEICHYCDYNKIYFNEHIVNNYLKALEQEIIMTKKKHDFKKVKSIFIGGGTPTSLTERQLIELTNIISKHFIFKEDYEYTIEANPDSITASKLAILKAGQVNRISFGVQTFDNNLLKSIGRTHKANHVYKALNLAVKANLTNINIDLMFGLPNQTVTQFKESILAGVELPIKHISCYSLVVERKTVFYNLFQKEQLSLPSENDEVIMFEMMQKILVDNGFNHYEIGNFAIPSFESVHNLTYWNNEQYYGFGAGAHRYLGNERASNVLPVNKYIQLLTEGKLPTKETVKLTKQNQIEEEMFLGLRKTAGISVKRVQNKFSINPLDYYEREINNLVEQNLLEVQSGMIKLTNKGRRLGNEVFQTFIK